MHRALPARRGRHLRVMLASRSFQCGKTFRAIKLAACFQDLFFRWEYSATYRVARAANVPVAEPEAEARRSAAGSFFR